MSSLEESAAARARSERQLRGRTAEERRIAAEIVVVNNQMRGVDTPQWVIDVAEGRLPA